MLSIFAQMTPQTKMIVSTPSGRHNKCAQNPRALLLSRRTRDRSPSRQRLHPKRPVVRPPLLEQSDRARSSAYLPMGSSWHRSLTSAQVRMCAYGGRRLCFEIVRWKGKGVSRPGSSGRSMHLSWPPAGKAGPSGLQCIIQRTTRSLPICLTSITLKSRLHLVRDLSSLTRMTLNRQLNRCPCHCLERKWHLDLTSCATLFLHLHMASLRKGDFRQHRQ
mmetsp:Transcript_38050/g.94559  ORF Transcript_38050/g.94559 Transcript_38050/m.94559 type:complete len:219 (-) Transcript_38050:197-853(-)